MTPAKRWSVGDIARAYGVTRQNVHEWTKTNRFPQPVEQVAAGRIWNPTHVRKWAATFRPDLTEVEQ